MSPRFVGPPASMSRRRPPVGPGLIALGAAIVALAFILLTVAMLEDAFGLRLSDVLHVAAIR
jgi:hypothetical protein